jgi:3-deoxy-D-manno-octulosonic-acid transferase
LASFEQGRPLIEKLKSNDSSLYIILSFFSPSGYELRKNYPGADLVCYLPVDTKSNAKKFLDFVSPNYIIFIKYEFWLHYFEKPGKGRFRYMLFLQSFVLRKFFSDGMALFTGRF